VTYPPMSRFDANLGWLFTELPFEERFDAASHAGFVGVEYSSPYAYSPQLLRERLSQAGLVQVQINSPAGGDAATRYGEACLPDRVRSFRDGLLRALEYADELDCGLVHLMGGVRPSALDDQVALGTYVDNVAWAADQAAGSRVVLLLEALNQEDHPGFVLESPEQAARLVRELGSEHLGLQFDVYHCQMDGGDVARRVEELMPHISHLQIADCPGRGEPGTGALDWAAIFDRISGAGYEGWFGCEYRPIADTQTGLSWMAGDRLVRGEPA
jgi:hydroxypyruvate isomerase